MVCCPSATDALDGVMLKVEDGGVEPLDGLEPPPPHAVAISTRERATAKKHSLRMVLT
jgi:hypothetical protein